MLTLEQCKNLKEWEFPQTGTISQWAYYRILNGTGVEEIELCYSVQHHTKELVAKRPDLEQLLEFANLKLHQLSKGEWHLMIEAPLQTKDAYWAIARINVSTNKGMESDPDPCQAVYKLIEKVMVDGSSRKGEE